MAKNENRKVWSRPKLLRMDAADAEFMTSGLFPENMDPTAFRNMS